MTNEEEIEKWLFGFGVQVPSCEPAKKSEPEKKPKKKRPKYKAQVSATRGDARYYGGDRYDIPYNQENGVARHNYSTEHEFCLSDQLYFEVPAKYESEKLLDDLVD